MKTAYDALGKSLATLSDENPRLCGTIVAAIDQMLSVARKKSVPIEKVHFSMPNIEGDTVSVRIYYGL